MIASHKKSLKLLQFPFDKLNTFYKTLNNFVNMSTNIEQNTFSVWLNSKNIVTKNQKEQTLLKVFFKRK